MQLLNVGFGNTVIVDRVVAVINTGSSPARKLKELAKTNGKLIDVTEGRRTRSILVMDSDHIILSSIQPDTISQRMLALQTGYHLLDQAAGQQKKPGGEQG
jgi:extracellular matrix regulatory protein A